MTTATATRLTGTIIEWHTVKGWGKIRTGGKTYFAHAKEFVGECACGQRHKCEIETGMTVEFMVTHLASNYPHDKYPSALEIRVKN